jgi:hypothetical protein
MKEKRANQNTKYGEATKVIRLPESLANFLQQYPSAINELVSQIKDGELDLTISVTACNSVTDNQAYDFKVMIDNAIAPLLVRLEALENTRTEATATAKKPLTLSQNQKVIAIQKLQATA